MRTVRKIGLDITIVLKSVKKRMKKLKVVELVLIKIVDFLKLLKMADFYKGFDIKTELF